MDPLALALVSAAAVAVAMVSLWLLSLRLADASIADVAWGPLFGVVALLGLALGGGWFGRRVLVAALVGAWALRLALHIGVRNRGAGEDPRYARWREEHGEGWPLRSLFQVFLLQGGLLLVVAAPLYAAQGAPRPAGFTLLDGVGALLWAAGFALEVVADAQLAAFKRDPERKGVLTTGVWRWSRHPNYFGEAVLWWGIGLVAWSVPWGWTTVVGPLLITALLRWVSGVPLAERAMEGRPGWDAYVRRTRPFLPLPKKA